MKTVAQGNAPANGTDAASWTEALTPVIEDLDLLNRNTEQDFLRIGGKLAEFIGAVDLISSELTALADHQQGLRASQALTHSLECSSQMSTRNAGRSGDLENMRQEVGRLKQTLSGFEGTVATVHTLGLLARIETARLGSTGAEFGNLAEDMKSLAANVQTRVKSALDIAESLLQPVESAIQRISAIDAGQAKDLPAAISGVLSSLALLREIQDAAHDSSVRLGAGYDATSGAFKKLIVSIQFHDITRQQVEHVVEVLRRLCSESEGEDPSVVRGQRGSAAVIALQSLQLADAGDKFAASVASVTHNLHDIATHVLEMADESRTLSGISADEKNSFLLDMERSCTAILASLTQHAKAESETQAIGGVLEETIGRMHGSIKEIQEIQFEMHLMALNALICATRIGGSGDALGALARLMQQRASEFRERSESLVDTLNSMSACAARISGKGEPLTSDVPSNQNGCMEEMRIAVAELHSSSERSFAQIAQIIARGTRLGEDISATRESFSVGTLFAQAVSNVRQRLKEIVEETQSSSSHDASEAPEPVLADFAALYTMQAERDVHEGITNAIVGVMPVDVLVERSQFLPLTPDDLGENVEFF
jgi:methyl-accepting chemotaxis protein